ncbi:MAG: radical SAM family heme chaperone HemW [Acidobacteria bacterium]|nr:radical SAM family heme chaperone HemW [Acidobacteriota bacterium]
MTTGDLGLYVHVPFCSSICNYCNFNRGLLDPGLKRRYVDALTTEVARAGDGSAADTIYFGGGTPSLLAPAEVARVVDACRQAFAVRPGAEVTLEMNPETVTSDYVSAVREAGVSRLSIGVQSFDDGELARLGRRHSSDDAAAALAAARAAGCRDVSLDLMLWLPAQTRDECAASVDRLVDLAPDHASLYLLEVYPNAPLRDEMARAGWSQAPDDDAASMYLDALRRTDAAGLVQYEISNVARPGRRSRHNLKYWQDGEWLGFGCGAHSRRDGWRWRNVSETVRYVDAVAQGESPAQERRALPAAERLGDALFMGLRLTQGIDLGAIRRRYRVDVLERYGTRLRPFLEAGMLVAGADRLRLTRRGMLLANEVMQAFV